MSADSDDEDEDTVDSQAIQLNQNTQVPEQVNSAILQSSQPETSRKRKYSESREDDPDGHVNNSKFLEEMRKRLKPYEIQNYWRSKGHLHLNRSVLPAELWHRIFTFTAPKTLAPLFPFQKYSAQVLKPDAIWRASRRHFKPSMPAPLVGQTELDMWRMACSTSCQFCSKKSPSTISVQTDQWHLGPGENGVIPIWSFAVRSCGHCILQHAVKEIDLLLSSYISYPRQYYNIVNPPSTTQLTKYYFKKHVEAIKDEFESVKAMGSATIEEWLKGLEDRAASNPPPRYDSPSQSIYSAYTPRSNQQQRHERTKEEVADLKAARRAEIERKCLSLDPPLTANVFSSYEFIPAAIQIIQPLNDGAWEVLKPRLLSQREEAEQRENDRIAQSRVVEERSEERRFQDVQIKPEYKDAIDREWDDIQAPLRARIGGYADETIRDGWNGGDKVTKESSPRFAADVLIYVRKRFYAEIAKDDAAVRATGQDPPSDPPMGPYTRKLTLENMKWVFDTKIKPHTEQYGKELFLCNSCENNFKYYGFEGVVQHFAAKHTSSLSVGSIVVHWKSEWPEYPPFCPDPNAAIKNAYYSAASSASIPYSNSSIPPNYGYGSILFTPPIWKPIRNPSTWFICAATDCIRIQIQDNSQYSAPPSSAMISSYSDPNQNYAQPGYGRSYPTSTQAGYTSLPSGQIYSASIPDSNVQSSSYVPQSAEFPTSYNQPPVYSNGNCSQVSTSVSQQAQSQASPSPQKKRRVQGPASGPWSRC
ncbi:hypothetical protein DID88_006251 [Monilinia fructigena]|uniref:F-box domain-containing protein n=1 Tax=Monilinia fructigena TaxID=38457 RepID=A0A395J2I8_9HELO|nr:hypothetical protein DID88_006251 [Monilinia fructigena]